MSIPQRPQTPSLVNEDARKSESLIIKWSGVVGAASYNVRIVDEYGVISIQNAANSPYSFTGLTPTKKYIISLQAQNSDGASLFSDDLITRTRPETPEAPEIYQDVILPIHLVKWRITATAGAYSVVRQVVGVSDKIVSSNGPLVGKMAFSNIPSGTTWTYRIKVVLPQNDVPGGLNESFWSKNSKITSVVSLSSSPALRSSMGRIRIRSRRV